MEFVNLEDIYKFYKGQIKIFHLLYENKKTKVIINCGLLIGWMLFYSVWIINKSLAAFMAGLIIYCISLFSLFLLGGDVIKVLKEKYNEKITGKNLDRALVMARGKKILEYLYEEPYKFKSKKQKESLITIFDEASQINKVNHIWIVGVTVTLFIPVWGAYVNWIISHGERADISSVAIRIGIVAIIILAGTIFLKAAILDNILSFRNRKSKAFKEMANIIRNDLIFNEYKRENLLKGKIIIEKCNN